MPNTGPERTIQWNCVLATLPFEPFWLRYIRVQTCNGSFLSRRLLYFLPWHCFGPVKGAESLPGGNPPVDVVGWPCNTMGMSCMCSGANGSVHLQAFLQQQVCRCQDVSSADADNTLLKTC